jgi:MGT family glycosyltransferase
MRFLFCSLASRGFLNPAIGMALSLEKRGHLVSFVTDQSLAGDLAENGLNRIPRGAVDGTSFQVANWPNPLSVAIQVKHIEYAVQSFRPDVLVGQPLELGSMLVRERQGIPLAEMGFVTYLWPSQAAAGTPVSSENAERKLWRRGDMLRIYSEVRKQLRMPPLENQQSEAPLLGDLFLLRSVPALEYDLEDLPRQVHLVGACLWEDEAYDAGLEDWLNREDQRHLPLIYVQQGRFFHTPHFWPALVEGLGAMPVRVAASSERTDCNLGALPSNFFVRPYVPQSMVLRRAATMVASANTTAVLGALTNGVSSLLIPGGGEQPDVAERCAELGVARNLPPAEVSVERLCSEVDLLLKNHRMKEGAVRMAAAFAELDGFELAADLLETLGSTRSSVPRAYRHRATAGLAV